MPKISDLPAGTTITGAEKFPSVQGAVTVRLTPTQMNTYIMSATKTLTNTTFDTAGAGNSFSINGLAASANTGTGAVVRATSPTLVTPALGTPSSVTLTNGTGLPIATGVANLGTGIATFLTTPSSANLRSAVTDETGTGSLVFATSPTLVTPALGTPSSVTLTNGTGLPIATGVANLGTGIATALAVNVGTSGAPVINGGALGTPSSGTLTNCTGYVNTSLTNSLSGNVALNNIANYFDGPSVAQGTGGTWFVVGQVTCNDTGGAANIYAKLWDGTTVIASGNVNLSAANTRHVLSLSGVISSPAGNLRISVRNPDRTTGVMEFNRTGNSKDCTITAVRIS